MEKYQHDLHDLHDRQITEYPHVSTPRLLVESGVSFSAKSAKATSNVAVTSLSP